jgi:valyl-tRNA synthetase
MIKGRLYSDEPDEVKAVVLDRALEVFDSALRLLHPFVPFLSEELWHYLAPRNDGESIMVGGFPVQDPSKVRKSIEEEMAFVQNVINGIRNVRGELSVPPSKEITLVVQFADGGKEEIISKYRRYFQRLARVTAIERLAGGRRPSQSASAVVDGGEIFIPLEGIIDLNLERERMQKEITRIEGMVRGIESKLANESFRGRAPKEIVAKEEEKLENFRSNLSRLRKNLQLL